MGKPTRLTSGKGDNGIVTTIRGTVKGDSTEELSGSDDTELGTIRRKDSWDENETGKARGEGSWETETAKRGIHLSTVVHISEEHARAY